MAKIKLMLTNVIVIVIIKGKIKNFEREGIIYTILIASKYKILPKSGRLQDIYLVVLFLA